MPPNFGAVKFWRRFDLFGAGFGRHFKKLMNFGAVHLGGLPFFGAVLAPNGNLKQFGADFLILPP